MEHQVARVSVVLICHNHERFLTDAVNSVLQQQTEFAVEILIGDVGSTDGSQPLLDALAADHADRIRLLPVVAPARPNDVLAMALDECHGQYTAVLECDDLWTDNRKLQRQADYLDQHPHCAVCYHNVQSIDENGLIVEASDTRREPAVTGFEGLVHWPSVRTSSALVRSGLTDGLPDSCRRLNIGDWPWLLLNARHGSIARLDRTMSACRDHAGRIWSPGDPVSQYRDLILALRRVRCESADRFHLSIDEAISEYHRLLSVELEALCRPDSADRHRRLCFLYRGFRSRLPLKTKISHAIRPCRPLHLLAAGGFDALTAPKRHGPFAAFVAGTILRQPSWILKFLHSVRRFGLQGFRREWHVLSYLFAVSPRQYAQWIRRFDTLTDVDREAIGRRLQAMPSRPVFSIIMPVCDPPAEILRNAIDSVRKQLYSEWELCIADDASDTPHVRSILEEYQQADPRIRCCFRDSRGNISAASNSALELATGNYIVCMDHDDELAEHALYMVAEEVRRHPDAQIIYSDQDRIDEQGRPADPYFKPDWNPDLMLSHNLICHLMVLRRQLVTNVEGFRTGFEGAQDYDLALRCIEQASAEQIRHIPEVLYHWRCTPGSVSRDAASSVVAHDAGVRALQEHLSRRNLQATVEVHLEHGAPHYRVKYAPPEPAPLVTLIVPTKDRLDLLRQCIDGLLFETDYPNMDILIIDNESSEPATLEYFDSLQHHAEVRVLKYQGAFNYSAINNFAARQARGEILVLLNNDTEVTHPDWLQEMVSQAVRPEIGAVGAKLLFPDDSIQHAGVIIGYGGGAGHAFTGMPIDTPVGFGRIDVVQNVSCVTAACLALRKTVFEEVGGLDEQSFAVAYNDVDLCLKIVSSGYRIVWTPYAQLYHHESASRGKPSNQHDRERDTREGDALRRRWAARISADPNLNPNISIRFPDFRPAFPPRTRKPWR